MAVGEGALVGCLVRGDGQRAGLGLSSRTSIGFAYVIENPWFQIRSVLGWS